MSGVGWCGERKRVGSRLEGGFLMMHNGRAVMLASMMRPDQVNLRPGEVRSVVCPDCGRVRRLVRGMVCAHNDERRADQGLWARCPGSGQRVRVDLSPAQWAGALAAQRRAWLACGTDPDTRAPAVSHRAPEGGLDAEAGGVPVGPGWVPFAEFTAATDRARIRT